MLYLNILIKIIIALSILNVWLLRYKQSSPYRGGSAETMKEEFTAYGLPEWVLKVVGTLKVLLSLVLLISIFYRSIEDFAAGGIAILMLGAIGMHLKIGDSLKKTMPAFIFLVLSLVIISDLNKS
ncbi:DoxX family protein [Lacinutrix neustonica]|uniref:DoxX family protein n=2 Tax=Lacinutrix neustonica TaxID=2980107 RepID=A0A9E8SIS4_9FLAO|nr:DoxX family protein [Lacinutrix neustonica]